MAAFAHVRSLVIVVGLSGAIGCAKDDSAGSTGPMSSAAAIDAAAVRLFDLDDQQFDLWNAGQNGVRVVIFTSSDCPVSNRYAPAVRELCESFHPRGVDFYLIYVDPSEKPEAIRAHLKEFNYPCQAIRDPQHTLVAHTQATVTPEAVVFDKDRRITYRGRINDLYADLGKARSTATKNDLRDAIEATLDGQPVAEPVTKAVGCYIGDLK